MPGQVLELQKGAPICLHHPVCTGAQGYGDSGAGAACSRGFRGGQREDHMV